MTRILKTSTVPSAEIQGPDSFVVLSSIKWGMLRDAQRLSTSGDPEAGALFAERLILSSVRDWNWTDDEGEALPLPSLMPDVIARLTDTEVAWLVEKISGQGARAEGN